MTQQFNRQNAPIESQSQEPSQAPHSDDDRNLPGEPRRERGDEQSRGEADPDQDVERGPGPERQTADEPHTRTAS